MRIFSCLLAFMCLAFPVFNILPAMDGTLPTIAAPEEGGGSGIPEGCFLVFQSKEGCGSCYSTPLGGGRMAKEDHIYMVMCPSPTGVPVRAGMQVICRNCLFGKTNSSAAEDMLHALASSTPLLSMMAAALGQTIEDKGFYPPLGPVVPEEQNPSGRKDPPACIRRESSPLGG